MKTGIELIAEERENHTHTASHDDTHQHAEIASAGRCYLGHAIGLAYGMPRQTSVPREWPWERTAWKPSETPIHDLVKAGALIAAEIDRLLRADMRLRNQ